MDLHTQTQQVTQMNTKGQIHTLPPTFPPNIDLGRPTDRTGRVYEALRFIMFIGSPELALDAVQRACAALADMEDDAEEEYTIKHPCYTCGRNGPVNNEGVCKECVTPKVNNGPK